MIVYPGNNPSNVNKDARYSIKHGTDGGWSVHLEYTVNNRVRELLTTKAHPKLAEMVNRVKREITGLEGGGFYINEYGHVIVPTPDGALFAGTYTKELRFEFEGSTIGPRPPESLQPGEDWPGPHVGIRYTLNATCDDIFYEKKPTPTRVEKVLLSDDCGPTSAARLGRRLAKIKGSQGGRIYINEMSEFFAPVAEPGGLRYIYLGHLDDDAWFLEPEFPHEA